MGRLFSIILLFSMALALSFGCAPVTKKAGGPVFYPGPPEKPRLQFLTSFAGSSDVNSKRSAFASFIIGKGETLYPIVKPYGVFLHEGKIYVADTVLNAIDVLDLNKGKFAYLRPKGTGKLRGPINVTVDKDGTKYVADSTRGEVLIFDGKDTYLGAIGGPQAMKPTDVAIFKDRLYIADLKDHEVEVWDKASRKPLFKIGQQGDKEMRLYSPTNLALDGQGNLYVTDTGNFRVQKYDGQGNFIRSFGSHGASLGQFARPKGVAIDREGRVYVADAAFENVQAFDPQGRLLLFFGQDGNAGDMNLPAKVHIDYENVNFFKKYVTPGYDLEYIILVSNQYGKNKINVYGFLAQK